MTTADYLNQLESDRQDLVDNLETKGITGLTGNETFTELVPEVLNISGGSTPTLRHIRVGDDLSNKKIYFTIPDNIRSDEFFSQTNVNYFICSNQDMTDITPTNADYNSRPTIHARKVSNGNFFVYVGGTNNNYTTIYYYVSGSLGYNLSVCDLNGYYSIKNACFVNKPIVWVDTTNPLYNYVWIENE